MSFNVTIHYANEHGYSEPHLWIWYDGSSIHHDIAACRTGDFGAVYEVDVLRSNFYFKFKQGPGVDGPWEASNLARRFVPSAEIGTNLKPG